MKVVTENLEINQIYKSDIDGEMFKIIDFKHEDNAVIIIHVKTGKRYVEDIDFFKHLQITLVKGDTND